MPDSEFYVVINSFAAPFFSDTWALFVNGETAELALQSAVDNCSHPCGAYSAAIWKDANAKEKGEKPLATWLSEKAKADQPRR